MRSVAVSALGKLQPCHPRPHPPQKACKQARYKPGKSDKMKPDIKPVPERAAWKSLAEHSQEIKKLHLRELFAKDATRGERFAAEACGLFLDYSKNRITGQTLELLLELAQESGLRMRMEAMFRGEKINTTENRAVLHVALRASNDASIL